jgi:hypothetical protein
MAGDGPLLRRVYEDPPAPPSADLVLGVRQVLAARDEVARARLRICIELLEGTEISRRPQVAVMLREQREPSDPGFRRLVRELVGPLESVVKPHDGTVILSMPAARKIFERHGITVFSRN